MGTSKQSEIWLSWPPKWSEIWLLGTPKQCEISTKKKGKLDFWGIIIVKKNLKSVLSIPLSTGLMVKLLKIFTPPFR